MSPHAMYWGIAAPGEELYSCPECGHLWEDEQNAHFSSCSMFEMSANDEEEEEVSLEEIALAEE